MSGYIDFAAVKQNVPIEAVCEKYGHPVGESSNGNARGQCPLPNHKGNRRDTFSVNREKNVWICFGCGQHGNVIDLMCALENCKPKEAAQKLLDLWKEAGEAEKVEAAKPEPKATEGEAKSAEMFHVSAMSDTVNRRSCMGVSNHAQPRHRGPCGEGMVAQGLRTSHVLHPGV